MKSSRLIMSAKSVANPDLIRWNEKYRQSGQASATIEPCGEPELVRYRTMFEPEPGEMALEVACGRGANALYLATMGYDVVAIDGAIEGLQTCEQSAKNLGLPVYPVVADLNDLVLPEATFALVSVVRYLQRDLVPALIKSLAPGGTIFYKTFSHHFLKVKPGFNPDYVLGVNELLDWFEGFQILATNADTDAPTAWVLARL